MASPYYLAIVPRVDSVVAKAIAFVVFYFILALFLGGSKKQRDQT